MENMLPIIYLTLQSTKGATFDEILDLMPNFHSPLQSSNHVKHEEPQLFLSCIRLLPLSYNKKN